MKNLTQFITSESLFETVLPSVNELVSLLDKKKSKGEPIKIFYGETYDEYGLTIDSLKYYFILSFLHFHLEQKGFKVESTVIQADVASHLNKSSQDKKQILIKQKNNRLNLINKIIEIYKLPIKVELMSNVFESDKYSHNINIVNQFADTQNLDGTFYQNLKKTVLKNKLAQENKTKFKYAKEAIATSMLFDIKIGPPREHFYDKAQNILTKEININELIGIYLKPTYPLGQNFAYFLTHPEIEEFGLTPYKAGSNAMQDFRIILNKTSFSQVKELVNTSFESKNIETAHPALDMYLIGEMAKQLISGKTDLPEYESENLLKNLDLLKEKTIQNLQTYIFERLSHEK